MGWWRLSFFAVVCAACAHAPLPDAELSGSTIEMRLDDGVASEKAPLPDRQHELLIRFDPSLPREGYLALTLAMLLAAPGHLTVTVYQTSPEGNPGKALQRIERDYLPTYVSSGKDGRWVIERLSIPEQHTPVWVGLLGSALLWTSSHDSSWVFQRDPNPSVALYANALKHTPLVRLIIAPTLPPK